MGKTSWFGHDIDTVFDIASYSENIGWGGEEREVAMLNTPMGTHGQECQREGELRDFTPSRVSNDLN